jgi:hypothetical protein
MKKGPADINWRVLSLYLHDRLKHMLSTPHTLVGLLVGAAVQNPYVAVPLAFLSHYVGDLVPHWDVYKEFPEPEGEKTRWKPAAIFLDQILGVAIGLSVTLYALWVNHDPQTAIRLFLCGIAAVTPDALYVPLFFWQSKNKLILLNFKIQQLFHFQANALVGNICQWSVATGAFLLLSNLLTQ